MKFAWWGWGSQLLYCKFICCLEHCVYSWNHLKVECLCEGIGGWGLVLFLSDLSAREINAYTLQQWKSWMFCFPISESLGGSPLHWCPWTCHGLGPCATSQSHATSQLTTYLCVNAVWLWRETRIVWRKKLNMKCLKHLCSTRLILCRMIAVHEGCTVFTDNALEGCVSQWKAVLVCKRRHEMWIPCKICSCGGRVFIKWKLLVFLAIQEIWVYRTWRLF